MVAGSPTTLALADNRAVESRQSGGWSNRSGPVRSGGSSREPAGPGHRHGHLGVSGHLFMEDMKKTSIGHPEPAEAERRTLLHPLDVSGYVFT